MSYPPPPGQSGYPAPPPYAGQSPAAKPKLRGGVLWRLSIVFFVLAVAAFVAGGVVLVKKSLGAIDDFTRVSFAAGSKTVQFERTGSYVAYYETPSSADDKAFVQMAIADSSGNPVKLATYGQNSTSTSTLNYDYHNHHGQALFKFTISEAGRYKVTLRSDDAASGADMAFGKSIAGGTIAGALLIVAGVVLLIVAIVLLIVGLVKRGRHKRELSNPYGGAGGYGYPPPPPGYQQQGYQQPGYPPPSYPAQSGYQQQQSPQPGYQPPGQPPSAQPEGYWTKPPS